MLKKNKNSSAILTRDHAFGAEARRHYYYKLE